MAFKAEVSWHIASVFGYDVGGLDGDDFYLLWRRFLHEDAHAEEPTYRASACRAFSWLVQNSDDPTDYAIPLEAFTDWVPTKEPFSLIEFD